MKKQIILSLATSMLIAGSALASNAFAQTTDTTVPGHPRVNEVDQRLENQQQRIDNGVASGKLTATQATNDEKRDANVAQKLSADEAKNGGHITKKEQANLNKKLDKNSKKIKKQKEAATTDTTTSTTTR